ncbi:transient receptor potential cation channel subfamily V member 6-like [Ruditapes philippinarum]|uniref:transient receptor potential cation channel subfamily V member 6-like n=1 Tax=Ruditapes philippinarum TaxID=129788 RepID=UPI00295BD2F2|nr:transient receptor potential cation channel subfamily V member 6-like [Ruditapes philippinarum]XP_060606507.1 transient receptor potential cation channel subfamily V member 6-like [Ruditapes philippinarum]
MATNQDRPVPIPTVGLGQSYNFTENNVPEVVKSLVHVIHEGKSEKVSGIISEIKSKKKEKELQNMSPECETILHRAVKMRANSDTISALLTACPELITEARCDSELYRGQTALHIAVTGEDIAVTDGLLRKGKELGVLENILSASAIGTRFENTVMLGEIPLIVAALTLNIKLFDKLIEYGAKIDSQNSKGDNVCHSLIRYANLYPEKINDIMTMVERISGIKADKPEENLNKIESIKEMSKTSAIQSSYIWLTPNKEGLNPLKLAAQLGQQSIFKFIMEMKGVYCYVNSEDGLFDVELYDVTDIDATSEFKLVDIIPWVDDMKWSDTQQKADDYVQPTPYKVPTLEMIFDSNSTTVFKFIELSPLRYVINRKWEFYKWFLAIWGILHMLFMIGYTVYAVRRSSVADNTTSTNRTVYTIGDDAYVTFYAILGLVSAFFYIVQEVIRMIKGRMPWTISHVTNCYHNGPLRLVLVLFAFTIVADFIWRVVDEKYGDYFLVCSMILGWWFLVFFLRGFRQFSFFTVMIQKVLVGDMFRFSIVIGMELIAFTSGIYIVFRGSPKLTIDIGENENVHEYSKLMIAMFKMMFGFTSLDVLFDAQSPWFAVCIYVAFVLLTYVLMINSLIAMMSNTCSFVSQNRDIQYRVQQLSIILFFESIFPVCCLHMVGQPRVCDWYDWDTKHVVQRTRSFMEVRSLHEVTKSRSRHRPNTETMLETIFHTIKNIQPPKIDVFGGEKISNESSNNDQPVEIRRSNLEDTPGYEDEDVHSRRRHRKKKKKKERSDDNTEISHNASSNVDVIEARNGRPRNNHHLPSVEDI